MLAGGVVDSPSLCQGGSARLTGRLNSFTSFLQVKVAWPKITVLGFNMSIFLYAYTLADAPHDLQDLKGVEGRNLFMVSCGKVSAIVSAYGQPTLTLSGDDIFAHQHVQRLLMSQSSIIPLHYGLTLSGLEQVEQVLSNNQEILEKELNRIFRKVEMEVTMRFEVSDLLDHLIEKYPYLRDEKGKVVNGRLLYFMGDRAKKGEKFTRTLAKEKEIYKAQLEEMIGPWCAEIRESRLPLAESEVVTFNCLVNRERLRVFEKSIYDAGDHFAPYFSFSFNGPWAPQNFCSNSLVSYK